MLIDLIDKLISRILDLVKEDQRHKQSMHDEFILPLMKLFDEIHEDYIQTFMKYREIIVQGDSKLKKKHPIFKEIEKDSIASSSMRIKLNSLQAVLYDHKYDELFSLLSKIGMYLSEPSGAEEVTNNWRIGLVEELNGEEKKQASDIIDSRIDTLLRYYSRVQKDYQELKVKYVS